ncbi:MAG: SDR family NAD(P)-dependent oxidoreductase [Propionicimonas sp.]|uniref:SDR family NAD(P)-dependent oxidoreductase n=1 Tax=Propionicimonas sp. TaxID=1955623 RepID=UPI003D10541B
MSGTRRHRRWLIAGVSGGFGRQLALQALAAGDRVLGGVRDPARPLDLAGIRPDAFRAVRLDVTDAAGVRAFMDAAFAEPVDVVVSNAGHGLYAPVTDLTDEAVEELLGTNLRGSINVIRAAVPHLLAQGFGRVVQVSSHGGQVATAGNALYHATKWGIEGFAEATAAELAGTGVGLTIVEPGGERLTGGQLDPANHLPAAELADAAAGTIASLALDPAPLRLMVGTGARALVGATLRRRIADLAL